MLQYKFIKCLRNHKLKRDSNKVDSRNKIRSSKFHSNDIEKTALLGRK